MWSAGVILYVLLCGYSPFQGENPLSVIRSVMRGKIDFNAKYWYHISDNAKDLVKKLITDRNSRLTAKAALSHPWFSRSSIPKSLSLQHLSNFCIFMKSSRLQQAAQIAMASQSNNLKDISDVFLSLAIDG